MKVIPSSPYATFNSKEWNSLVSKREKFVNTPIKVNKKYLKAFTFKKNKKAKDLPDKNELHKQMKLIFA